MYTSEYLGMAIITGVMGFLRAWIHVPIALVIADHLPAERYNYMSSDLNKS